ncbi:YqgE/AlgH family protein [Kitasatospora sp. NBC_01287]|uniref:YqgE/AlgH family protein n=1 Tax=Kitasatospora sp. NBC_01287 TaxID=2903573 RepID=UPI00225786CC|nr:YqgE/AlgH family protein [Kitasatospora sp. NBC_01287]MCX4748739.1 YqgE/AlgH family protein [Kitasatospora sp. NBC_01287]
MCGMTAAPSHTGRLLVATPVLTDPNFARSVVLLLDHDEQGALGVVLNRPTPVEVGDVLDGWAELAGDPQVVFQGGPVGLDSALAVAVVPGEPGPEDPLGWRRVHGAIGLVDLEAPPQVLAGELGGLRVFAGYSGWTPGQLEAEIAEGAWYLVDAEPGDISCPSPERLWRAVLRRQRGVLAMLATYPEDPTLN